jgi:hypothetical protein
MWREGERKVGREVILLLLILSCSLGQRFKLGENDLGYVEELH